LTTELYFNSAMPNPYDVALRERAVKAYESGEASYAQLAALFDLDHRTLERWVARWRATGSVAPQPKGGGWPCPIDMDMLHRTTRASLHRALKRAGFVLKKNARARVRSTGRMWQPSARRS
jgi:transposase